MFFINLSKFCYPINKIMDYSAFSQGQIFSKIWLCEELEPHIQEKSRVAILGSWYNILGFMLMVRRPNHYSEILGVDIDNVAIELAEKLCHTWTIGSNPIIKHINANANDIDIKDYNVVINCSAEHMESDLWYDNIAPNTIVCLQSTNLNITDDPWKIINPNTTLDEFAAKYQFSHTYFKNEKVFDYDTWGYSRYMLIGIK